MQGNANAGRMCRVAGLVALTIVLGGCLESEESSDGFVNTNDPVPNNAPTIAGVPSTTVTIGGMYSFKPSATDADNDTLVFSIRNKPRWADFDTATGRLWGQPTLGDEGSYTGIGIAVSDGKDSSALADFSIRVENNPTPPPNAAPVISGTPSMTVAAGTSYVFAPQASDPDGDTLQFSIQNPPAWATFNAGTGQLAGQPDAGDVGVYSNILISVSDGQATASLPTFAITVEGATSFSVTLSWTPPDQNDDGSPLDDLAGFRLYWGTTPGGYTDSVSIDNPGITTYVIDNLPAGTYEFVATAYNDAGVESVVSDPATTTLN